MHHAITHAFMGVSYVVQGDVSKGVNVLPEILRLKSDTEKENFLLVNVSDGDNVYIELGGAGDKLALIAHYRGAKVIRLPSFTLGDKDAVNAALDAINWKMDDERPHAGETADKLTARRNRALALFARATQDPASFTVTGDTEQRILLIKQKYRSYRAMQKTLLATYQRLLSTYNDQYLLELAQTGGEGALLAGNKVHAAAAMSAINALLTSIPENERAAFLSKLGIDALKGKKLIPRKTVASMFRKIIDALVESDSLSPFVARMAETKKEIEKLLKADPIFRKVFDPIPGCGPLISARIIASIVDIRGFADFPKLKAYAGYHHFSDGSRSRRVAGKVSNWSTELKQAVFLWTEQTLKMSASPWRARLDQRRAYELFNILTKRQLAAMDQGLDYEILPKEFTARSVTCANDMSVADLAALNAHVDILRKQAGVKSEPKKDEDEEESEEAEVEVTAKDPALAKLVRGVKMQGLQKAKRWLGQMFLKHIFKSWRHAIGLSEFPTPRRMADLAEAEEMRHTLPSYVGDAPSHASI